MHYIHAKYMHLNMLKNRWTRVGAQDMQYSLLSWYPCKEYVHLQALSSANMVSSGTLLTAAAPLSTAVSCSVTYVPI